VATLIAVGVILAVTVLAVGALAALLVRQLPSVRLQLGALAFLAVTLPLGAVLASGWVMFHMHDDVKILAVSTASALSAIVAGLVIAQFTIRPLDQLRLAARQLAGGDLGARVPALDRPTEVADLATAFNEMAASLERTFDARRQVVAWASHDLRTPLAAMRAMLEAVEDGLATPDEYLRSLREQVDGLSALVDDLFELACIDAGALTLELERMELDGVVESCVRTLEAQARTRGITLRTRLPDATPPVRAAPDKVERILLNLLTNALRHTPSDGAVVVLVEPSDGVVRIAVEDTGDGLGSIPSDRVFDGFWKGDRAASGRASDGGAGLGLAIAQGLVKAQGGEIWAEERPGGGARFVFALPAAA
jgi:signal transduction histidine kinase